MNKFELEKELKQMLLDVRNGALITPILKKFVTIAHCGKCWGKGYGTETKFSETGMPDFGPDDGKRYRTRLPEMVFCDCQRGKDLMRLWNEGRSIMYRAFKRDFKKAE